MEDRHKQSDDHPPRHHSPFPRSHSRSPTSRRSPPRSRSGSPRHSMSPHTRDRFSSQNSGNTLYVAGLPPHSTNKDLRIKFEKYGKVLDCHLVSDPRTKQSRGFGFVKMENVDDAEAAIRALHKIDIDGKPLTVEKAKRGKPRTPTPGRYLGNDRFRGGRGGGTGGPGGRGGYHRDERRHYSGPPLPADDYYSYYPRRYDYSNYYASRYDPYTMPPRSRSPGYFLPPSPNRSRGSGYYKTSPRYYTRQSSRSPSPGRSVPYYYRSHSRSPPRYRTRGPDPAPLS